MVGMVLCTIGVPVFCMTFLFYACGLFWIFWRFCVVYVFGVCIFVCGLVVVVFCIGCGLYAFSRYYYSIDFCNSFIVGFGVCMAYGNLLPIVIFVRSFSTSRALASSTYLASMAS
jgi:hypothetical protein